MASLIDFLNEKRQQSQTYTAEAESIKYIPREKKGYWNGFEEGAPTVVVDGEVVYVTEVHGVGSKPKGTPCTVRYTNGKVLIFWS